MTERHGDLLIGKQIRGNFDSFANVVTLTNLVNMVRLLVYDTIRCIWFLVLGIIGDCCPIGVRLRKHYGGTRTYWLLDFGDASSPPTWQALAITDYKSWRGQRFEWGSPLKQFALEPNGRLVAHTNGAIVFLTFGPEEKHSEHICS